MRDRSSKTDDDALGKQARELARHAGARGDGEVETFAANLLKGREAWQSRQRRREIVVFPTLGQRRK